MFERKKSETTSWNAGEVRRKTERKTKKRSRGMNALIYVVGVVLCSCLLAGIGWLMVNDVCALNKEPLEVTLRVEKGDTVGDVATKLKKEGLIESKFLFKIFAGIFDAKDVIAPGTYELDTTMDFLILPAIIPAILSCTSGKNITTTLSSEYSSSYCLIASSTPCRRP